MRGRTTKRVQGRLPLETSCGCTTGPLHNHARGPRRTAVCRQNARALGERHVGRSAPPQQSIVRQRPILAVCCLESVVRCPRSGAARPIESCATNAAVRCSVLVVSLIRKHARDNAVSCRCSHPRHSQYMHLLRIWEGIYARHTGAFERSSVRATTLENVSYMAAHVTVPFGFATRSKLAKAEEIGNSPCVLLQTREAHNRNVAGK